LFGLQRTEIVERVDIRRGEPLEWFFHYARRVARNDSSCAGIASKRKQLFEKRCAK